MMPSGQERSELLVQVPSLRSLHIFEVAARHLNLVRAAEELGLTQGALSRQIKSLEQFIGAPLFFRTPRGLQFTEAGDALAVHCQRAFAELQSGLLAVTNVRSRQTLLVAMARSYGSRVLSKKIGEFALAHPWIDLTIDGHRHLADLTKGEADIAIRVGDGKWQDVIAEKLADEPLFPVIAPKLAEELGSSRFEDVLGRVAFLHFSEKTYWEDWANVANVVLPQRRPNIRFSESAMMIEAAEAGQGIAMGRNSLVEEALAKGQLIKMSDVQLNDGIAYFLCYTQSKARRATVKALRKWLVQSGLLHVAEVPHPIFASLSDNEQFGAQS
ncbi:LysR family transcriptional regulator [Mesorhizobium sp. BH1-1-5]|uniref:LysR substrate-binding domain-containing protein n=1 Tax=Mesorhizobium sp. BH1-1-5 TaxID=2876661 RepID=UPI001CCD1F8D|nr:LysR substrate-binding domain-containing protein [Mesorhizobium sp. BH1-1-5]MBZ9988867.1 LysR family transcriptional regulator [Mesorhizobium sp. BH1-1-5]